MVLGNEGVMGWRSIGGGIGLNLELALSLHLKSWFGSSDEISGVGMIF